MPEISEVRIMSEFINSFAREAEFQSIRKSDVSKVKTDLSQLTLGEFTIVAKSRGKELLLDFYDSKCSKFHQSLLVTMGMSGNWTAAIGDTSIPKHSHLVISGSHPRLGKISLCLVDIRRFAKWSWKEDFSPNRGPDPVKEHEAFRENFKTKITEKKQDKVPMLDVIMNQSLFNGIGNYLRAEIFHRADVNPFRSFSDLTEKEKDAILTQCKVCPEQAYVLGGGQLKDWKNSFEVEAKSFLEWRKVYGVGENIPDKGKRTFWFDSKWKETEEFKTYTKS